jgi:hypothetical protein
MSTECDHVAGDEENNSGHVPTLVVGTAETEAETDADKEDTRNTTDEKIMPTMNTIKTFPRVWIQLFMAGCTTGILMYMATMGQIQVWSRDIFALVLLLAVPFSLVNDPLFLVVNVLTMLACGVSSEVVGAAFFSFTVSAVFFYTAEFAWGVQQLYLLDQHKID